MYSRVPGLPSAAQTVTDQSFPLDVFFPAELIIPIDYLTRGLSISKQTKVPWKQLFRKAPIW